jgi:serine phosphatase RsbU (regulator of sigma subunit)
MMGLLRRDTDIDLDTITPSYSQRITERQRLQHELAIARSVQMSFLPKGNPAIASLDIASRCVPALEVGGDYYDFIELPNDRLAVAVGDVSGKGTQAAFFMTLTKGFLRALSRISHSPGTVLQEVNRLFYENVDRGVFISLIYGIFEVKASRLTIARAGHNPVILRKSGGKETQVLDPMGLALGLDKGDVFEQSIKEVSVTYEKDDVFVFYTDGISEAMNGNREEFGVERLSASIESHSKKDAAGILEGVLNDMQRYVGKMPQHDDVTLVIVKIS